LLKKRYQQSITQNGTLRADLLAVLAHLCGNGGAKQIACDMYEPLFREALIVNSNTSLRLAAAQGLSHVDKIGALELFKQNNLMDDESLAIQHVVISLAGQTGDSSDLEWLLASLADNGHADQVWISVKSICERQNARFLLNWLPILEATTGAKDEYTREILNIAEQKATGEKDQYLLIKIQEKTISWYADRMGDEQGAAYIKGLGEQIAENDYSDQTKLQILRFSLYGDLPDIAIQVLLEKMLKANIPQHSPWYSTLEEYFSDPVVDVALKWQFFEELSSISIKSRPGWESFLQGIEAQLNSAAEEEDLFIGETAP
jgi:hypothetical protein